MIEVHTDSSWYVETVIVQRMVGSIRYDEIFQVRGQKVAVGQFIFSCTTLCSSPQGELNDVDKGFFRYLLLS